VRAHFGTAALCTLRPEPFGIDGLKPDRNGRPALSALTAELFFGHFERGGDPRGQVGVEVLRTLDFQHLEPHAAELPELRYLLFGQGPDLFLAHRITTPPDFDHLLTAQLSGAESPVLPPDRALTLGLPGRENGFEKRLAPGEQITAAVRDGPSSVPDTLGVQVLAEVYLETDDLAS
ncbi:hypothetical protein, partial [Streptomyces broussonetiae]|uniref:hypothetical protein n=1 Tax=Streptomyces broussonetiae TaxID=2686304 RepID=UPI0035DEFE99